jgi:hypothetical protein
MVHNTAPNDQRFTSYDCRKLDQYAESEIWADYNFRHKSGIWRNLSMTSPETLNWNFLITNPGFYRLLIQSILMHSLIATGFWSQDKVLNTRWTDWSYGRFRNIRSVNLAGVWTRILKVTCSSFHRLLIHMFPMSIATVMVILVQPRAELPVCWKSLSWTVWNFWSGYGQWWDYEF